MVNKATNLPLKPRWDELYDLAALQSGYFSTKQAAEAGISPELLIHHKKAGRIQHVQRGIYRVRHFPPGDHEQLAVVWLWAKQEGVFSHDTALALHDLSDILPALVHITVPTRWRTRRVRVPPSVLLHYADIPPDERAWFGTVPITKPNRTLRDCINAHLTPDLLEQALEQAGRRGIISPDVLADLERRMLLQQAGNGTP